MALPFALIGSIGAAGEYLNSDGKVRDEPKLRQRINLDEKPNGMNIYENQKFREVRDIEQKMVDRNFKKSFDVANTNVTPRYYNQLYAPFEPEAIKNFDINLNRWQKNMETLRRDGTFGGPGGPGDPRGMGKPAPTNQLDEAIVGINQFPTVPGGIDKKSRMDGSFARQQGATLFNPNVSYDNVQTDLFYYPTPRAKKDLFKQQQPSSYNFNDFNTIFVNTPPPKNNVYNTNTGGWQGITGVETPIISSNVHQEQTLSNFKYLPSSVGTKTPPTLWESEAERLRRNEMLEANRKYQEGRTGFGSSKLIESINNNNSKVETFNPTISGPQFNMTSSTHNNMVPFFGSHVTQNTQPFAHQRKLENFTGQVDDVTAFHNIHKREIPSLFHPVMGLTYPYGKPNSGDYGKDRYIPSRIMTNISPVEKVYIGPGLNIRYGVKGTDGFHQTYRPTARNVDQLRVNPKKTYLNRTIAGKELVQTRGVLGKVYKNRPDKYYLNTKDRWFKTTGAVTKTKARQNYAIDFGRTTREDTTTDYYGPITSAGRESSYAVPLVKHTDRQNFLQPAPREVNREGRFPVEYDYGRSGKFGDENNPENIENFSNTGNKCETELAKISGYWAKTQEREDTEPTKGAIRYATTQIGWGGGGGGSALKVYDPEDITRTTGRNTLEETRVFGNAHKGSQTALKVYDPNDIAKTTVRNTTEQQRTFGNVRQGNQTGLKTYDPNDIAKTTVRNTTEQQRTFGNVRQGNQTGLKTYDPNDIAKTTVRNTTEQQRTFGNVRQGNQTGLKTYDPNDIAKTTVRNTTEQQRTFGNVRQSNQTGLKTYDPNDIAKTTVRNTTEQQRTFGNIRQGIHTGLKTYDPNDIAKTTVRNTTEQQRTFGNARQGIHTGLKTYDPNDVPKTTIRNTTDQTRVYGNPEALDGVDAPRSYEDMYNAEIDARKEVTLYNRKPTKQGVKNSIGSCNVNMVIKHRDGYDTSLRGQNPNKVYNIIQDTDTFGELTRGVNRVQVEGIRQPEDYLVDSFRENPYTQPLDSVAAY
jgi:hypothetical protein